MKVDGGHVEPGTFCSVNNCPREAEALRYVRLSVVGPLPTVAIGMCAAHAKYFYGPNAPAGFDIRTLAYPVVEDGIG